jgi:hypothetical protein
MVLGRVQGRDEAVDDHTSSRKLRELLHELHHARPELGRVLARDPHVAQAGAQVDFHAMESASS